jgi:hypothetical protein
MKASSPLLHAILTLKVVDIEVPPVRVPHGASFELEKERFCWGGPTPGPGRGDPGGGGSWRAERSTSPIIYPLTRRCPRQCAESPSLGPAMDFRQKAAEEV